MPLFIPKHFLLDSQAFKGNNYVIWKTNIQAILEFEDLCTILTRTE